MFLQWRLETGHTSEPATIAMISSPAGLLPLEANPLYSTTKAGLHSFTLSLRWQLRDTPVAVVEVFPPASGWSCRTVRPRGSTARSAATSTTR